MTGNHLCQIAYCCEVKCLVPAVQQGDIGKQRLLLLFCNLQIQFRYAACQQLPQLCLFHFSVRFMWISSRDIAAGVMPGMRDA